MKLLKMSEWFQLDEGIKPTSTSYGTNAPDFNNHKIDTTDGYSTLIKFKSDVFLVVLEHDGSVGFGRAINPANVTGTHLNYSEYTMNQTPVSGNVISALGMIMFVVFALAKQMNAKVLHFTGAHPGLTRMYLALFGSNKFNDMIEQNGWRATSTVSRNTHEFKLTKI